MWGEEKKNVFWFAPSPPVPTTVGYGAPLALCAALETTHTPFPAAPAPAPPSDTLRRRGKQSGYVSGVKTGSGAGRARPGNACPCFRCAPTFVSTRRLSPPPATSRPPPSPLFGRRACCHPHAQFRLASSCLCLPHVPNSLLSHLVEVTKAQGQQARVQQAVHLLLGAADGGQGVTVGHGHGCEVVLCGRGGREQPNGWRERVIGVSEDIFCWSLVARQHALFGCARDLPAFISLWQQHQRDTEKEFSPTFTFFLLWC